MLIPDSQARDRSACGRFHQPVRRLEMVVLHASDLGWCDVDMHLDAGT